MITLTSDFGSPYPAAMRGVILQRCDARLVDVSHELPRGDVRAAAFWLTQLLVHFPPAVHLVVVDPGVGTERNALVVRAGEHVLVGPDNGVLVPVAKRLADGTIDSWHITTPPDASRTFHGRDVFAPAAAAVHEEGLEAIDDVAMLEPGPIEVEYSLPEPTVGATHATGTVLTVDDFGNVITSVPGIVLEAISTIRVGGESVPVVETFGAVDEGERLVTVGSHGNLELDVNGGRGDEAFGLEPGDEVRLEWD